MEKLTTQQLKGISKLLHHIHDKGVTQHILAVLGKENWSRPVLIESCEFLNEEQEELFEFLGGCYTSEEMMSSWIYGILMTKLLRYSKSKALQVIFIQTKSILTQSERGMSFVKALM